MVDFCNLCEKLLGFSRKATTEIKRDFNFQPKTDLRDGMKKFAKWYKNFYVKGIQENDLE